MKSFSDDIVTPEAQNEAIKFAFVAQNAFILNQANTIVKRVAQIVAINILCTACMLGGVVAYLHYFK